MKAIMLKAGIALALSATMFTACEKSDSDVAAPSGQRKMTAKEIMSHPQVIDAYKQMKAKYESNNPDSRVEFTAPWFTSDGFGLSKDLVFDFSGPFPTIVSGQFAFFMADLNGNDYWRVNNDGTISVHVSSNSGYGEHFDIASGELLTSNDANVTMNYTGPVVSFDITDENGNVIFTISFIDIASNPKAVSMHGNAMVSENGTGPEQNLVARWVCNPGWTQVNIGFDLN